MSGTIRMVCFDLGGVIVKHHRSWREACAATGMEFRSGIDDPALVARRRALTHLYHVGEIGCEAFFTRAAGEGTGGLYTAAEVRALHDAWIYAEYEGIGGVLERLVRGGRARTGVLSNTNAAHWARIGPVASASDAAGTSLPHFPSAGVLEHRHASHLLGLAKPDEAIYRAYEDATGARGGAVLFFDDLAENVATARTLGWHGVLVDHTGDTARQVEEALRAHGLVE